MAKRTNRVWWWLPAMLAGAMIAGSAAAEKLYPVDEGPRDPSFLAFRNRLIAAVKRHDLRFINSILDPHVTSSFGDEETVAAFRRMFEGKHPEADLWKDLLIVIS